MVAKLRRSYQGLDWTMTGQDFVNVMYICDNVYTTNDKLGARKSASIERITA